MRTLAYLLLFIISFSARASAVRELTRHLRPQEYQGTNRLREKCIVDIFPRTGGDMLVQLFNPRRHQFLVKASYPFESVTGFLRVQGPWEPSESGRVAQALVIEGRDVRLERDFCGQARCWVSDVNCTLEQR